MFNFVKLFGITYSYSENIHQNSGR